VSSKRKFRDSRAFKVLRVLLEAALAAALVIVLLQGRGASGPSDTEPNRGPVTVSFYLPDGTVEQKTLPFGARLELPEGRALEGYTFLGWRDARGSMESRRQFSVYEDCGYAAVYAMALGGQEHLPYLDLSRDGLFRPYQPMTRREAAVMLYRLLDTELVGSAGFLDVPETDACHAAASTLKSLGVVSGSRFHPDDPLTRGELMEMLACFYPQGTRDAVFADLNSGSAYYASFCTAAERGWIDSGAQVPADADDLITRAETARLLNRVLGRGTIHADAAKMVGTILDVSFKDPLFWDIAEACIPHRHKDADGGETWSSSTPLPLRAPGFFFINGRLHLIDGEGSPVTNEAVGNLSFNANGEVTSGMPELDALLAQILRENLDQPRYRDITCLKILYDYTVRSFSYQRRNLYESGETGWEAQEAYTMLSTGRGNCYNFAAVFGELARFLGFDAKICSGKIYGFEGATAPTPHAWVDIEINDELRLFDAELAYVYRGKSDANFFNRGQGVRNQFGYQQ